MRGKEPLLHGKARRNASEGDGERRREKSAAEKEGKSDAYITECINHLGKMG